MTASPRGTAARRVAGALAFAVLGSLVLVAVASVSPAGATASPAGTSAAGAATAGFSAGAPAGVGQQGATVSVGNASGPRGANVSVPVTVRASNVSSYEASVTFDPDVVRVVAVEGGDFSAPVTNVDNGAGRVNVTQANVDGFDDPVLARITFEVVGSPSNETVLGLAEGATALFDDESVELHVSTYRDGRVTVDAPDTPTPTPTAPSAVTPAATATETSRGPTASPTPASGGTASTAAGTDTPDSGPDAGDGGDGSDSDGNDAGDSDDSSDDGSGGLLDSSFLLGAGSVVVVVLVGGLGYYLGQRRSGPSGGRLR